MDKTDFIPRNRGDWDAAGFLQADSFKFNASVGGDAHPPLNTTIADCVATMAAEAALLNLADQLHDGVRLVMQ